MFPGMGPKNLEAMMKKMGIKTENISADEVIIKGEKTIVIKEPQITLMEIKGQKTFQIIGRIEEVKEAGKVKEEDIELVMEKTGASREKAVEALEKSQGDIAKAILSLTD